MSTWKKKFIDLSVIVVQFKIMKLIFLNENNVLKASNWRYSES